MRSPFSLALAPLLAVALAAAAHDEAQGFPHVVRPRETLAELAQRFYGNVEREQVLVVANGLDLRGGTTLRPGMRLEIPVVQHHRTRRGDSWRALADAYLGLEERGDVLALMNDAKPWIPPREGAELVIPYALRYHVNAGDSTLGLAYRFLGSRERVYWLDGFNQLRGRAVREGDVLLLPLHDVRLTPAGLEAASAAEREVDSAARADVRAAQQRVQASLPALEQSVRQGDYVSAVAKGAAMLGGPPLARADEARVHRSLLEALVALDSWRLAEEACAGWRAADPTAELDPISLSPKIIEACTRAIAREPPPRASGSAPPARP
jgi:hypothetical protein